MAGVACTILMFVIGNSLAPALRTWWMTFEGPGPLAYTGLTFAIGVIGWIAGQGQKKGDAPSSSGSGRYQAGGNGYGNGGGAGGYYSSAPPPNGGPRPSQAPPPNPPPPPPPPPQPETPKPERPHQSWQEQPQQSQEPPRPQPQPQPQPQRPNPPPTPEPEREEPKPQPKPQPKAQPQPRQAPQPSTPRPSPTKTDTKGAWEKAREETRRREEERKTREAELRRKEENARRLRELREREAREREQRERDARTKEAKEKERKEEEARERARLEKEVRDKVERELREKVEREAREAREREAKDREAKDREAREREAKERELRAAREREVREREAKQRAAELLRMREEERQRVEAERRERELKEAREREAKEARERKERLERAERERLERARKAEQEANAKRGTSYAYSAVGEKTNMWPNGKPPAASETASSPRTAQPASPSPTKPTAASARGVDAEEETYSYRPYDKPKKPTARKKSVSDFSESSWAPSATTARTTPPPSMRGPYTSDDPNKIVVKAVYAFLNQFSKTPAMQLVSGMGTVTDGLILRINSAGFFVDDDVRGMPQREWDVKAWTIKQVEVWCPTHAMNSASSNTPGSVPVNHPFFKNIPSSSRRAAERGATKTFMGEEAVAYLQELGRGCQDVCRRGLSASAKSSVSGSSNGSKTGEWSSKGLHIIRVQIRDQEGKRYLFVIDDQEAWKISKCLDMLRGSSQVRALGFTGISGLEAKSILETLNWGS